MYNGGLIPVNNNANKMMPVVYISGKMTGLPDFGRAMFNDAQRRLEAQGYRVLNPACSPLGLEYDQYMRIAFAMLEACDIIALLPNWEDSNGAKAELAYATCMNKQVCTLREGRLVYATKAVKDA